MNELLRKLVYLFKLNASRGCAKIVGGNYDKLLTLYNFCSWRAEIVENPDSKQTVLWDFAYEERGKFYSWINDQFLGNVPIDYLEFGVYQGESIKKWLSINKFSESRFVGFDTFEGLPEKWGNWVEKGAFATQGAFPDIADTRAKFVRGLFQQTLPGFLCSFGPRNQLVIHLDADLYSSTLFSLVQLNKVISSGTILIFDEFGDINHEFSAFREFTKVCYRKWSLVGARRGFDKVAIRIL